MKTTLKIISIPTEQSTASVAITCDDATYVFNTGEGCQRIIQQNKFKISKLKTILFSRIGWDCLGGLPGMILTATDSLKINELSLVGPVNLINFVAANYPFLNRPGLKLSLKEVVETDKLQYQDSNIKINARIILPDSISPSDFKRKSCLILDGESRKRRILSTMFQTLDYKNGESICIPEADDYMNTEILRDASFITELPSVSYLCEFAPLPRKMDGKKVQELGVKNLDRRKLVQGETVISESGKVVHPDDCLLPQRPPSIVIVLDCPSLNYIDNLLNDTITKVYCQRQENPPSCIVHQLGKGILNDPRYLNFIGQIHSETKQIFLAPELNDGQIIFYSSAELLTKLSAIDSEMFQSDNYEIHESLLDQFINSNSSLIGGTFQTELVIDPNHKLSTIPKSSSKTLLLNGFLAELSKLKELESNTKAVNEPFPYVVTLGTGSCQPSKYRNVSSSLIALKNISILLDAGEGTLGQIYRHYGTCFDEELLKIKYIFISHLHADHHLGTFGIVKKWAQLAKHKKVQQKLFISAPLPFLNWIKNYAQIESCGLENIVFVDNSDLVGKLSQENHNSEFAYLLKSLSLKSVESVPVQHCYLSYGVVIETLDGFKVSYSGDCRPSSKLAKVGEGSDLLIHEATFRDALIEEAIEKNHSTVSEAIDVGLKMKAKNVLLTHFSQKYPMMTELPENKVDGITIGYAFDMMKIKMSDFWKFNYIVPILDKYLTKIEEI